MTYVIPAPFTCLPTGDLGEGLPLSNTSYKLSITQDRITEEFEVMVSNLSLEEIIALKLELATKTLGGKFFGFPIWHSMHNIVQDAVLKYAFSTARTQGEAMRFLGLQKSDLNKLKKKYKIESYFFEKEVDKKDIM